MTVQPSTSILYKKRYHWVLVICMLLHSRCTIYQHTIYLQPEGWSLAQQLQFPIKIQDATQSYDIYLHIQYTTAYPYQNIYVDHAFTSSSQPTAQFVRGTYILFDSKTGVPPGIRRMGVQHHKVCIRARHQFSHTGVHTLLLAHGMRPDKLAGIKAISISVVASPKTKLIKQ